jgi:hypothetical protein
LPSLDTALGDMAKSLDLIAKALTNVIGLFGEKGWITDATKNLGEGLLGIGGGGGGTGSASAGATGGANKSAPAPSGNELTDIDNNTDFVLGQMNDLAAQWRQMLWDGIKSVGQAMESSESRTPDESEVQNRENFFHRHGIRKSPEGQDINPQWIEDHPDEARRLQEKAEGAGTSNTAAAATAAAPTINLALHVDINPDATADDLSRRITPMLARQLNDIRRRLADRTAQNVATAIGGN